MLSPWRLLAAATVAAGVGINGGFWPPLHGRPVVQPGGLIRHHGLFRVQAASAPQGIIGFSDRLFGIGPGNGWGDWLVYQGTLMAVIVATLAIMLVGSPVNHRVLFLLGIPFALGAIIYLCSLINPPPSGPAGNALAALPLLLILLTAVAVLLAPTGPAGPDAPPAQQPPGAPDPGCRDSVSRWETAAAPRRCGLRLDAVYPLDPPVAPPGGHEAHGEPMIGREGSTAHLRGEQQRSRSWTGKRTQ
jgi:hypothetical protein